MSTSFHRHATIVGAAGVIETGYANHAPSGTLGLRVKRGVPGTIPFETEEIDGADGFRLEAESFARWVRTGAGWDGRPSRIADTAAALAAIAASMKSGRLGRSARLIRT